MLTESAARWMLVLHTVVGMAAVGAATHLVVWMRGYPRGNFGRHRAVRRFAVYSLVLHAAAFLAGNVMYPTYKVQVRTAYLENAGELVADYTARDRVVHELAARERLGGPEATATGDIVKRAAKAARWFDVKEHWVALGLMASAALVLVLALWDPRRDGRALVPVVLGLGWLIAATVWIGAIIGVLTASWRAV